MITCLHTDFPVRSLEYMKFLLVVQKWETDGRLPKGTQAACADELFVSAHLGSDLTRTGSSTLPIFSNRSLRSNRNGPFPPPLFRNHHRPSTLTLFRSSRMLLRPSRSRRFMLSQPRRRSRRRSSRCQRNAMLSELGASLYVSGNV